METSPGGHWYLGALCIPQHVTPERKGLEEITQPSAEASPPPRKSAHSRQRISSSGAGGGDVLPSSTVQSRAGPFFSPVGWSNHNTSVSQDGYEISDKELKRQSSKSGILGVIRVISY